MAFGWRHLEPSLLDNTTSMQSNSDNNDQNGDEIEDVAEIEGEHFVCFAQKLAPRKKMHVLQL